METFNMHSDTLFSLQVIYLQVLRACITLIQARIAFVLYPYRSEWMFYQERDVQYILSSQVSQSDLV